MNLRIKANLKKATSRPALMDNAEALLTGPLYTLIPTLLGVDGPAGMALAAGGTWLVGAMFDSPGIRNGAVAALSTHLMYTYAGQTVIDVLGRPIFRADPAAPLPPGTQAAPYSLNDRELLRLDNGDTAYGYQSADLPSSAPALSDRYVGSAGNLLSERNGDAVFGGSIY